MGRTVGRSQSNSVSPMKRSNRQPRISYAEDPLDDLPKSRRIRGRPKGHEPRSKPIKKPRQREPKKKPTNADVEMSTDEEVSNDSVEMESESSPDPVEIDPAKDSLIEEIKTEYKRVKKIYDDRVMKDGYDFFDPEFKPVLPKIKFSSTKAKYPSNKMSKPALFESHYTDGSRDSFSLPRGTLTHQTPLPRMRYWTHTNVNIVGKDECALSHVPYLGDGEDEPAFTEELLNAYEEGIHGEKTGWGKIINDYILYHITAPILEKHKWTDHSQIHKLMLAIYELFPNKDSAKVMTQNYADLVLRFNPTKTVKARLFDEVGELKQNFSAAMIQSSNRNLVCKRCYMVDCIIHPTDLTQNDVHIERAEKIYDLPKVPCGPYCYRNYQPKPVNKKSPKKRTSKTPLEITVPEDNVEWTPHEESMVNLLKSGKITSNCRLTQLLSTLCRTPPKTCKQVYDYINGKGPFSPLVEKEEKHDNENDASRILVPLNHRVFRTVTGGHLNNLKPYVSCRHPGECSLEVNCLCRKEGRMCNKYCGCSTDCRHRFPGCRCKPGNCRTNQCQCFFALWECDPDMCHSCNCDGMEETNKPICKNINIQRCLQRKLYIAPSDVAGTGCFAEEFIPKGEYIGEYVGEIISQQEAERRGKIYDKFKCSYLFTLNEDQVIDATRVGNIMRFINHSKHPNCGARIMIVNADHRIALYALTDIQPHEELFFDYSYNSNQLKEFVYIEKRRGLPAPSPES